MRINNNLNAMNTHRQLGLSALNGSKSMEKLSSGFRINRAGDDAAGLAISEKMRGQIRGLNMASKNSSDTISLIQTAEGALSETHAILQRMRELAVQSANDTNTDTDRKELQAEIKQLKAEIDRIGNTTEFNTKKLLEGSAKGVSEAVVGSMRVNNNSGVVLDPNKMNDMQASIANDRNWAFDGAYMLIKTGQTFDATGSKEYRATDYQLVGPDGTMYNFTAISQDTKVQTSDLKAGTIVADGGVVVTNKDKEELLLAGTGEKIGENVVLMRDATPDEVTTIAVGSILAEGSKFTLAKAADNSITINGVALVASSDDAHKFSIGGEDKVLSNGQTITVGGVTLSYSSDDQQFTIVSGNAKIDALGDNAVIDTIAAGSTLVAGSIVADGKDIFIEGSVITTQTITLGASVDDTQLSSIAKNSTLAQGSTVTLSSGGSLNIGVATTTITNGDKSNAKAISTFNGLGDVVLASGIDKTALDTNLIGGAILAEGSSFSLADGKEIELNNVKIKLDSGTLEIAGHADILLAGIGNSPMEVKVGNATLSIDKDGLITVKNGSAEVSADVVLNDLAALNLAADSVLKDTQTVAGGQSLDIRSDWTISYNAGIMTISDNGNTRVDLEVGKSLTLDNGTIIRNNGSGEFEILSGSLKTGTDMSVSGDNKNITGFNIASQSIIAAGSATDLKEVDLVSGTNYKITDAGKLDTNITVGNGVNLTNNEVTALKAGTVLASGSNIAIADNDFIMLDVNGKELRVSWDANNAVLTVGDQVVAAGKSITLENGAVLTNQGSFADPTVGQGVITVSVGSITLGRDISEEIGNVKSYVITKDSTLAAGTSVAKDAMFGAGTVVTAAGSTPFSGSVTLVHEGKGVQFSANAGNTLNANIFETKEGESFTFVFSAYEAASSQLADSLMSQIGANSGQTSFLSIGDMRAKALGIDRVDVSSKFGAATAIETVNNALQRVSHQRSLLGAVQNRLEHTIKNLDTAAENLQAAESRIRDVDMAREIMEHTKNNILQQASQAMLAQANQQPQSVLQLLR